MTNRETMPTFRSQDGRKEMRDWTLNHSIEEVSTWTEKILKENPQANPLRFQRFEYSGSEMLKAIVVYENNPEFTEKIFQGLLQLSNRTQWDTVDTKKVRFIDNFLGVIGSLKINQLYPTLLNLVANQTLRQPHLEDDASRLHVTALASLGAFGCNESTVQYFERDIEDPACTGLCYRMLWKYDRSYAGTYANLIREVGAINDKFPTDILLKEAGQIE